MLNIASDVRWGRVEETYGEDPYLASLMGRVFVAAFESAGIVTTPKHFVANVGEGGRDSYPIDHSARSTEGRSLRSRPSCPRPPPPRATLSPSRVPVEHRLLI